MSGSLSLAVRSAIATAFIVSFAFTDVTGADDWPGWRGPRRDGLSLESGLLAGWPAAGPPLAWKATGLGEGYSSMAIAGGVVVTMGTRGSEEQVIALDAATGKARWSNPHGAMFRNDRGDGPRGTPTIDGERVYALGANGNLSCFKLDNGVLDWSLNVLREFGGRNPRWGLSESPLLVGDALLVTPGGRGAGVVALDKHTGAPLWKSQSDEAGYSSGVVAEIDGVRQAIFFTGERLLGLDVKDGRLLWSYGEVANRTANVATPIVRDDLVFVSSDYGTGCALLRVGSSGARPLYFNREMRNHHSSSVLIGEHVYGFSSAVLTALRFTTGEITWRDRSVGKGSLIAAGGQLYLLSERGTVALAAASPDGYREAGRFELPRASSLPIWSHPALAEGRLYLRDQDALYAYDVRAK